MSNCTYTAVVHIFHVFSNDINIFSLETHSNEDSLYRY